MKNAFTRKIAAASLVLCLLLCSAAIPVLAKSNHVSASGTVVNKSPKTITSDYGGKAAKEPSSDQA